MKELKHPNIVQLKHAFYTSGDKACIAQLWGWLPIAWAKSPRAAAGYSRSCDRSKERIPEEWSFRKTAEAQDDSRDD